MNIIRKAETKDIDTILDLLVQVCNVHSNIRPDLFKANMTKYTKEELVELLKDEASPIFVYEENSKVLGYGFTKIIYSDSNVSPTRIKTLYIDDICIDENYRGHHIGMAICNYIFDYAKSINCHNVTLNVWEGNEAAKKFYQSMGMEVQKYTMEKII